MIEQTNYIQFSACIKIKELIEYFLLWKVQKILKPTPTRWVDQPATRKEGEKIKIAERKVLPEVDRWR